MPDLTKLHSENDEIKIEPLSTKELARELAKKSIMVPEIHKKTFQKDLEKTFIKNKIAYYIARERTNNKFLCENLILPAAKNCHSYYLLSGFHFNDISIRQYKQVIKIFTAIFENLNFLVVVIHDEHLKALQELGFYRISSKDFDKYFDIEMLSLVLSISKVKTIMIKNKKVSYLVH